MRRAIVAWALAAAAILSAAGVNSQENLKILRPDAFPNAQRPPVAFAHDAHNEKAGIEGCQECHHVYQEGNRVPDESSEGTPCAECHGLQGSGRQPGLMTAFHLNCKGCHQAQKKGPVMCGECHVRK